MRVAALLVVLGVVFASVAVADDLPVREVTVFKDGHAFVLHEGAMPVTKAGHVVLDRLPAPVLGTFWPFDSDEQAELTAVRASSERVSVERTALALVDLIAANVGAKVIVTDVHDQSFHARVLRVPTRSTAELEATSLPGSPPGLPQRGQIVLLETGEGVRAMQLAQIREVVFKGDVGRKTVFEEMRNRLTLELDWNGAPARSAKVGMVYVQKGLRWIPNYQVDLLDDGKARVRLQATLVNDLVDLDDVSVNLVIGVPTFAFKDMVDPVSLQAAVAQTVSAMPRRAYTSQMLSNAIMSQARMADPGRGAGAGGSSEDDTTDSTQHEDLYVFHLEHLSLAKGQRLVVSVAETTVTYEDVYTLDVPFSPPPEVWPHVLQRMQRSPQEAEAARMMARAKVMHKVRLKNGGPHPLTTAPALILKDGRVLAQGLLTYTSVGGTVDLAITQAVDVNVKKEDRVVEKTPRVVHWSGNHYGRIDMKGAVTLTNYKDETVHVEVDRFVLGQLVSAEAGGELLTLNALEDASWIDWQPPVWWQWYNWPHWWYHFNGAGKVSWDVVLEPGETLELGYEWQYFWP